MTADRHMQEAIACSPCHRLGYCLNKEDQSCAESCECLVPIASALAAAEERGREGSGYWQIEAGEDVLIMRNGNASITVATDRCTVNVYGAPAEKVRTEDLPTAICRLEAAAIRARKDEP